MPFVVGHYFRDSWSVKGLPCHFFAGFKVGDESIQDFFGRIKVGYQLVGGIVGGVVLHEIVDGTLHVQCFIIIQIFAEDMNQRLAEVIQQDRLIDDATVIIYLKFH